MPKYEQIAPELGSHVRDHLYVVKDSFVAILAILEMELEQFAQVLHEFQASESEDLQDFALAIFDTAVKLLGPRGGKVRRYAVPMFMGNHEDDDIRSLITGILLGATNFVLESGVPEHDIIILTQPGPILLPQASTSKRRRRDLLVHLKHEETHRLWEERMPHGSKQAEEFNNVLRDVLEFGETLPLVEKELAEIPELNLGDDLPHNIAELIRALMKQSYRNLDTGEVFNHILDSDERGGMFGVLQTNPLPEFVQLGDLLHLSLARILHEANDARPALCRRFSTLWRHALSIREDAKTEAEADLTALKEAGLLK